MQRTIEGDDPIILRRDMLEALTQVPEGEINAGLVVWELFYLIGYSYEVEGNSAESITYYRQLIEAAPDNFWSWLAFARLSQK